jgi:hypothetical protein
VDSGSSHTFVSASLAAKLSGAEKMASPMFVQDASSGVLSCTSHILAAS